jgi:hypothetical protein
MVELVEPPMGSQPGERVTFMGYPGGADEQLNPKKKVCPCKVKSAKGGSSRGSIK